VDAEPQGLTLRLQKVIFGQDHATILSFYSEEYVQCQNLNAALVFELENFTLMCLPTQRPAVKVLHESVSTVCHPRAHHIHNEHPPTRGHHLHPHRENWRCHNAK